MKRPSPGIGKTGDLSMKRRSQPRCLRSNQPNISVGRRTTCGMLEAVDELFLRGLGLRVEIVGLRVHDRGGDMDEVGHPCRRTASRMCSVAVTLLATNSLAHEAADLGLVEHHGVGAREVRPARRPAAARSASITVDVGMELAQDRDIGRMLVDADDAMAARLQARHEILADEAGRAGDRRSCAVIA